MKLRLIPLCGMWLAALPAIAQTNVPEPFTESDGSLPRLTYGDARSVSLLSAAAESPDVYTRELAVRHLGETHNPLAIAPLRKATDDPDVAVRAAVAVAAAEFTSSQSGELLGKLLGDKDRVVVLAALGSVRRMGHTGATGAVGALLDHADPLIQANALTTLTHLGKTADAAQLKNALSSSNARVRLLAAENAALLTAGADLPDVLSRLAEQDVPAVRGAALAALGKLDFARAQALLAKASRDENPLVRRGAVRAYALASRGAQAAAFLDDPAALVRLAAIEACRLTRHAPAVDKLITLMCQATDELTHRAGQEAILAIATPEAAGAVARKLIALAPEMLALHDQFDAANKKSDADAMGRLRRQCDLSDRNAIACCRILGKLRNGDAFDTQISLLAKLPTNSPVLGAVASSLGDLGDRRAVEPLAAALDRCAKLARKFLVAQLSMSSNVPPFDEYVAASIVEALGKLRAVQFLPQILQLAGTKVQVLRLNHVCAVTATILPDLATDANRGQIDKILLDMLRDEPLDRVAVFQAAKTCGRFKLASAVEPLGAILKAEDRPASMIQVAAWAIQQITGKAPPLPEPSLHEGEWVVKQYGR